jgi:site-specific recombinase XerD
VAGLREHRAKQDKTRDLLGADYEDRGVVFATSRGTPFTERNALRALKKAADATDVADATTLHDLRRMTASILVACGVDITTAAAPLGHKKALRAPKNEAMGRVQNARFGSQLVALTS